MTHSLAETRLPPVLVSELEGVELVAVARRGVLVRGPKELALRSHGAMDLVWSVPHQRGAGHIDEWDDAWVGGVAGEVRRLDAATGATKAILSLARAVAFPVARIGDVLLVDTYSDDQFAVDVHGRELWRHQPEHRSGLRPVTGDGAFVVCEQFGGRVLCLDAATGATRWAIDVVPAGLVGEAAREYELISGYPSVTCWGDRVVVIRRFREVLVLDLATGRLIAAAESPMPGHYAVTDEHVYFFSTAGLVVFDHRQMCVGERVDLGKEIQGLCGSEPAMIRGFAVTRDAVFWSAPEGILMGVRRAPGPGGVRATWRAEVGGLSPISVGPVAWANYLYWNRAVVPPDTPALLCFEGRPDEA